MFLFCFFFVFYADFNADDIHSVHLRSVLCVLTSEVFISACAAVGRISQKRKKTEPTMISLSFPTGASFSAAAAKKEPDEIHARALEHELTSPGTDSAKFVQQD